MLENNAYKRDLKLIRKKAKEHTHKFATEFKKTLNTAMVAALGLVLALVWKDVITEYVDQIAKESPLQGKIISAAIVTAICVCGILLLARLTQVEEEKSK